MKIKTLIAFVCLFVAGVSTVRAQSRGAVGAGVILGNPTGVTGKLWFSDTQAVDAGLGFSTRLAVYGDYLWHGWTVLSQPSQGRLPVYLGLGAQVRTFSDAEFGIRTVVGLAYWLAKDPVELFVEVVPVFRLAPGTSVGLDGGLGLRYYFAH